MKKIACVLTVFCLFLVAAGCREKKLEPGVIVADKRVALADMEPTDIIVSVNGKALTRKEHDDKLDLQVLLYSLKRPSATKASLDVFRTSRAEKAVADYVVMQLVLQEGQRLGIRVSPEDMAAAELRAWRNVSPRRTGDNFTSALGSKAPLFKKAVADEEHARATRNALFSDRLEISEADIDRVKKRMEDWNAVYADSNRVVMARGEEIVRELRAGADFAEMAKEVSQFQPETGELWGEFTHAEIEDKTLRDLAFSLPVGEVSDPVDTEDGLVIIRVLERVDGAAIDSPLATQVATVTLARILLLMYNPYEETSRDQVRTMIFKDRNAKIQQEWMPKLFETARIEYPNGTNLWTKSKGSAKRDR